VVVDIAPDGEGATAALSDPASPAGAAHSHQTPADTSAPTATREKTMRAMRTGVSVSDAPQLRGTDLRKTENLQASTAAR
jgi:hypothetical protein